MKIESLRALNTTEHTEGLCQFRRFGAHCVMIASVSSVPLIHSVVQSSRWKVLEKSATPFRCRRSPLACATIQAMGFCPVFPHYSPDCLGNIGGCSSMTGIGNKNLFSHLYPFPLVSAPVCFLPGRLAQRAMQRPVSAPPDPDIGRQVGQLDRC